MDTLLNLGSLTVLRAQTGLQTLFQASSRSGYFPIAYKKEEYVYQKISFKISTRSSWESTQSWYHGIYCWPRRPEILERLSMTLESLRSRFFSISREPRTSRSHVTVRWLEACSLRFTFERLDHFLAVSDLPQGFFHPKTSQSHVWEEILLLETISLITYEILFHGNLILKAISQVKQKWTNEWKQTWQLAI